MKILTQIYLTQKCVTLQLSILLAISVNVIIQQLLCTKEDSYWALNYTDKSENPPIKELNIYSTYPLYFLKMLNMFIFKFPNINSPHYSETTNSDTVLQQK